jgi:predicted nucleic acid-binding protein
MAGLFFDTSALGKYYHREIGTDRVDELIIASGELSLISRLSIVELHSVFAKKVRTKVISADDFELLRRRFAQDVRQRRFQIVRLTSPDFDMATKLIRRIGLNQNLRTLDALQLAIALKLREKGLIDRFICADQNLCILSAGEGLTVINPEIAVG